MPCRTCGGRITREQAQSGICPHCGAGIARLGTRQPSLQVPVASSDAQNRQPKAAQKPGDTTKWIIAGAVALSVTLLCVAGFAVARAFFASSDPIDTVQIEIVQPPVLPEEVIPSEKPLAAPQSAVPTPPATDEPAPEQPTPAEPNIAELLRQRQIALQANIDQQVDEALKLVQKYGYGHVVVGQLKMEGNASPRDVVAQMEILDDGHFVEAVATAGAPLYFWHAGYDRLDVIPRGQKGEVENLGEVVMKPSRKPGGVVKGIMHSFLSGVPKDLNARIEYSIPVINRCGIHDLAGRPFERDLLARLKFPGTESVDFRPETGEFKISGLPEIRFFLSFHSSEDEHDAVLAAMEISPGEETDLGLRSMAKPLAKDDATTPILELKDWAPNGKEQVKKMLTQLEGNTSILKYFQENLDADVRKVDEWRADHGERSAVVIVGKAEVPGNEFARSSIMAQMDIADGGYFCAAVRPGLPVGFRLHGYEPLDYVPKGSHDGVEFCGILRMKKTPVRDTASVESSIVFEGGQAPPDLRVTARECVENINWWEGGQNIKGRRYASFATWLQPRVSGNRFKFDRLSPIPYDITVSAFGRTHQVRRLNLQKDDHRTLVPFTLFRDRNVTITLLPSKDGNFVGVSAQQSTIPANGGELRSTEDPAMFEDRAILTLLQSGNSISNIGPGSLDTFLDLGHRGIDECRVVNGEAAMPRNYNTFLQFSLREGHVYLSKDWNLGGPCALFRVDSVSLAPINGK